MSIVHEQSVIDMCYWICWYTYLGSNAASVVYCWKLLSFFFLSFFMLPL